MVERRLLACTVTGLALGALGATVLLAVDGFARDTDVVSVSPQNGTTTYPDGVRYNASVLRVETWALHRDRPYELWITRGPGPTGHGHMIRIGDLDAGEPPKITVTDWRPGGVRVRFTTGHEVFVPARQYLGGR